MFNATRELGTAPENIQEEEDQIVLVSRDLAIEDEGRFLVNSKSDHF